MRNVVFYATRDASAADLSVLTCGGTVTERLPIAPAIPCWRLAELALRRLGQSCRGSRPATYISAIIGGHSGLFVPQSQANACRGSSKKR